MRLRHVRMIIRFGFGQSVCDVFVEKSRQWMGLIRNHEMFQFTRNPNPHRYASHWLLTPSWIPMIIIIPTNTPNRYLIPISLDSQHRQRHPRRQRLHRRSALLHGESDLPLQRMLECRYDIFRTHLQGAPTAEELDHLPRQFSLLHETPRVNAGKLIRQPPATRARPPLTIDLFPHRLSLDHPGDQKHMIADARHCQRRDHFHVLSSQLLTEGCQHLLGTLFVLLPPLARCSGLQLLEPTHHIFKIQQSHHFVVQEDHLHLL